MTYLCPYHGPARGVLTVTNYKLYFKAGDKDTPLVVEVPLGVVSKTNFNELIFCNSNLRFLELKKSEVRLPEEKMLTA